MSALQDHFLFKYEATGNDFLVVDSTSPFADESWAPFLCDRRFGIGADGLLIVTSHTEDRATMVIVNADGSRPEMCGNGARCVAAYLLEHTATTFPCTLETDSGDRLLDVVGKDTFRVAMGIPTVTLTPTQVSYDQHQVTLHHVSMGNPHAVCFQTNLYNDKDLNSLGAFLNSNHTLFTQGVNLEVVERLPKLSGEPLACRVYERGVGETASCGTGACAVVVAAIQQRFLSPGVHKVHLPGGSLCIEWGGEGADEVFLSGPAHQVMTCQMSPQWYQRFAPLLP